MTATLRRAGATAARLVLVPALAVLDAADARLARYIDRKLTRG